MMLCENLTADIIKSVHELVIYHADLNLIACHTLFVLLRSASRAIVSTDGGLRNILSGVSFEADYGYGHYPWCSIGLLSNLLNNMKLHKCEMSVLGLLLHSYANFGQAIGIEIALKQMLEARVIFDSPRPCASLSWALLHSHPSVAITASTGVKTLSTLLLSARKTSTATYLIEAGCVPILWISERNCNLHSVSSITSLNFSSHAYEQLGEWPRRNKIIFQLLHSFSTSFLPNNAFREFLRALAHDVELVRIMFLFLAPERQNDSATELVGPPFVDTSVIIRSSHGDAKMSVPPPKPIEGLSIPALFDAQSVKLGKLPVLWGSYLNLDHLFSDLTRPAHQPASIDFRYSLKEMVDVICIAWSYQIHLPAQLYSAIITDCHATCLVQIILSALKYGASSLAVSIMAYCPVIPYTLG